MKKFICAALAVVFLLGAISACGRKQPNISDSTGTTEYGYEENVFENSPTTGNNTQNQDPTKATEDQSNASGKPAGNQQGATTKPAEGQSSSATQPAESQQGSTTESTQAPATEAPTSPTTGDSVDEETLALAAEYETYSKMSASEKEKYRGTFADYAAFFEWYNNALAAYKAANPPTVIGPDGTITLN